MKGFFKHACIRDKIRAAYQSSESVDPRYLMTIGARSRINLYPDRSLATASGRKRIASPPKARSNAL